MENINGMDAYEERRKQEREEAKETRKKLLAVVKALKFKEKPREEDEFSSRVTATNGDEEIWLVSGTYDTKGRIRISGGYPKCPYVGYVRPRQHVEVTVSVNRDVEAIVKDVERRFFAPYREELAYVKGQIENRQKFETGVKDRLTEFLGRKPSEHEQKQREVSVYSEDGPYYTAHVGDEDVSLNIHRLTIKQAKAILKLVGVK